MMALPATQISQKQETHGDTIRANRKLRLGNHHDEEINNAEDITKLFQA